MTTIGRYELLAEIGGGGMATVNLGRLRGPAGFGRVVAIKRMHRELVRDPNFVAMFVDEAKLAAQVNHPNVVQTFDVVQEDGELSLVMEYVHGTALVRLMRAEPVPAKIAMSIACGLLHGLHAAHEATDERGEPLDIVHRDVSPHNVLVGADGVTRVFDFGIAKAVGQRHATREGEVKGKLAYMAPEQVTSVLVTRRADVFAASIILWEMLTGERLFRAETEQATLARVMLGKINAPGISSELDAIVLRGLAREPNDRYATARDMARDLEKLGFASQTEVGEWVSEVGAEDLAERTKKLMSLESGERQSVLTAPETPRARDEEATLLPTQSATRARPTSRGWFAVELVAAAVVGGVGVRYAIHPTTQAATQAQPTPSAPPAQTIFELIDPATAEPSVMASAPITTIATTAKTRVVPRPSASAMPTTSALLANPDCNPPSFVGADGRRHYKPECFKSP